MARSFCQKEEATMLSKEIRMAMKSVKLQSSKNLVGSSSQKVLPELLKSVNKRK